MAELFIKPLVSSPQSTASIQTGDLAGAAKVSCDEAINSTLRPPAHASYDYKNSSERVLIRGIVQLNAVLTLLAGLILLGFALLGVVHTITNEGSNETLPEAFAMVEAGAYGLVLISLTTMGAGAMMYLSLYVEEHLLRISQRPI